MARPPLSSIGPGDEIPLDLTTWNAMIGAGRDYLRTRPGSGAPDLSGGSARVLVANDTGAALDQFAVLALGDPLIDPTVETQSVQRMPCLSGAAPAAATDSFAVLQAPAESGAMIEGVVFGVTLVNLLVNDAAHTHAAPVAGQTGYLGSAENGPAKILWKDGSSGTVLALVQLVGDAGALAGTGTDNHVVRWDGTTAIQDSTTTISDDGHMEVGGYLEAAGLVRSAVGINAVTIDSTIDANNEIELHYFYQDGFGNTGRAVISYGCPSGGPFLPYMYVSTQGPVTACNFILRDAGAFGIQTGATLHLGLTGTLGPGAAATGGVVTSLGSGSFGDALTSGTLAQFAATTSAQLKGVISDETGSGALVFATSPTLVTPALGVASATSLNKVAVTAPATGSTLTIDDGFTLHATGNVTALSGSHTGTSSGTNTGDQTSVSGSSGSCTGNAATATALATGRAINGVTFDGTAPITVTAAAGTLSGAALAAGVTGSSLTSVGTLTGGATGSGFTVALGASTITGTLPAANMPALTGDITSAAGAVATTISAGAKVTIAALAAALGNYIN